MRNLIIVVLALFMFMISGPGSAVETEATGWEHLPESLRAALARHEAGMVVVYRWSSLGRHPVMRRAAEARSQGVGILAKELPFLAQYPIDLLTPIPLDTRDIEEMWILTNEPEGKILAPIWIRTEMNRDALLQMLTNAGWHQVPGACPDMMALHVPPPEPSENELANFRRNHPELSEEPLSHAVIRTMRICPRDNGWAELLIPRVRPSSSRGESATDRGLRRLPPSLTASGPGTLMTGVLLVAQHEPEEDSDENLISAGDLTGLTPGEILNRLHELEGERRQSRTQSICDIFFSITETTGGLQLALEGTCPAPFEADLTATTAGMILALLRVTAVHLSPALSHELGQVHVRSHGNLIRSEVTVSTASLLEAIDTELAYWAEVRRLWAAFEAARGR